MNDHLFYKTFTGKYNNRLISLARNASTVYASTLDENRNMQIIYKSKDHKIIHLNETDGSYNRTIILDDKSNTYNISNLKVTSYNGHLFLFYTANNPYDGTCDLIFHQIDDVNASPQSLFAMTELNASYDITVIKNKLYLLCFTKDKDYELGLYAYNPKTKEWLLEQVLKNQSNPITYATFCKDAASNLHIIYMSEQFGQHQLFYLNTQNLSPRLLHTSAFSLEPIVFKYKNHLWVNWLENKTNKFIFSIDNGFSFCEELKSTLQQDNLELINFINPVDALYGTKYYGTVGSSPVLSVLSQIDLENILLDQNTNQELNLLINHLQDQPREVSAASISTEEVEELEYLKQVQDTITKQYNELSNFAKQLQEEGKKWKNKYMGAELEMRKLKEEISSLKTQQAKPTVKQQVSLTEEVKSEAQSDDTKDDIKIDKDNLPS
jgi:hypothetical protein